MNRRKRAQVVVVAAAIVATFVALSPSHADVRPAGAVRPGEAVARAELGDPIAQARKVLGSTEAILDFEGCAIVDTRCPIDRPSAAALLRLPDADGDGRDDVLSLNYSWSPGNTQQFVVLASEREPVSRTIAAGHDGRTGAVRWKWRAVDGKPASFMTAEGDAPESLFVINDGRLIALNAAAGDVRWVTPMPDLVPGQDLVFQSSTYFLGFADLTADAGRELLLHTRDGVRTRLLAVRAHDGVITQAIETPAYFSLAGDLDADGAVDLITVDDAYSDSPTIRAVRGTDGTTLWERPFYSELGFSVTPLGDLDGDGRDDLAVGTGYYLSDDHEQPPNLHLLRSETGEDRFAVHASFDPVAVDGDDDGDLDIGAQRFAFASSTAAHIEARYLTFAVDGTPVATRTHSVGGEGALYFGLRQATYNDLDIDGDGTGDFGHQLRAWDKDFALLAEDSALTDATGVAFRHPAPREAFEFNWMLALDRPGRDILTQSHVGDELRYQVTDAVTGTILVTAEVPIPERGRGGAYGYLATSDVDGDGRRDLLATVARWEQPVDHDFASSGYVHTRTQVRSGRTGALLWELEPIVPTP